MSNFSSMQRQNSFIGIHKTGNQWINYPGVSCFSKLADVLSMPLTGLRWWCAAAAAEDAGLFVAIILCGRRIIQCVLDGLNTRSLTLNCCVDYKIDHQKWFNTAWRDARVCCRHKRKLCYLEKCAFNFRLYCKSGICTHQIYIQTKQRKTATLKSNSHCNSFNNNVVITLRRKGVTFCLLLKMFSLKCTF